MLLMRLIGSAGHQLDLHHTMILLMASMELVVTLDLHGHHHGLMTRCAAASPEICRWSARAQTVEGLQDLQDIIMSNCLKDLTL